MRAEYAAIYLFVEHLNDVIAKAVSIWSIHVIILLYIDETLINNYSL